jgi:hypothetical protein
MKTKTINKMEKIQSIIETCNECIHCKIFEQKGNNGGPYAAICMKFNILLKIHTSWSPLEYTLQIPNACELIDFKISSI